MRRVALPNLPLFALLGLVACTGGNSTSSAQAGNPTALETMDSPANGGTTGTSAASSSKSSGGNTNALASNTDATGGKPADSSGSTDSDGGADASSDSTSQGGKSAARGNSAKGGNAATGGSAPRGGNSAKGGNSAAGGDSARGGDSVAGGMSSRGGDSAAGGGTSKGLPASSGGKNWSMGGTTASGGTSARGGSATGGAATGGASTGQTQPRLSNGAQGWASRYWDCCKPSCGWSANASGKNPVASCGKDNARVGADTQSACSGGGAYQCWDYAPWSVSDTLSYGFAAYNGVPCGTCFQLDFTGGSQNSSSQNNGALANKTMIVQVINIGGIQQNQFDLLIPGGGVGDFNACSNQWGVSSDQLGKQYGGFLAGCNGDKSCVQNKCSTVLGSKPALKAGCDWFTGWFNAADNPTLKYAKVNCPSAITAKSGMQ